MGFRGFKNKGWLKAKRRKLFAAGLAAAAIAVSAGRARADYTKYYSSDSSGSTTYNYDIDFSSDFLISLGGNYYLFYSKEGGEYDPSDYGFSSGFSTVTADADTLYILYLYTVTTETEDTGGGSGGEASGASLSYDDGVATASTSTKYYAYITELGTYEELSTSTEDIQEMLADADSETTIGDSLLVKGDLTVNGSTTLGDSSSDTITINGTTEFNSSVDMNDNTISGLKGSSITADSTYAVTGAQLYEEQSARESADTALQTSIDEIETDLTDLIADVTGLESTVDSLETDLESLEYKVTVNSGNITTLQDGLEAAEAGIETNTSDIEELQAQVASLSSSGFSGDMGGEKITSLGAGTVSSTSTDAVNGSQLYAVQVIAEANAEDIADLQEQVSALSASGFTGDMNDNTIYNLAAGEVSSTSTDAVNGSQLYAVKETAEAAQELAEQNSTAIESLSETVSSNTESITVNASAIAELQDTVESLSSLGFSGDMGGEKITSLGEGDVTEDSTDAVNGSQLYAVLVTAESAASAVDSLSSSYSTLSEAVSSNTESITVNASAIAELQDTVESLSSLGFSGDMGGEKITSLGEGDVTEDSTDAVNGSQLYAVLVTAESAASAVDSLSETVASNTASITVNASAIAELQETVDTLSSSGFSGDMDGGKITNLAAGDVTEDSTDAVNGSQLYAVLVTAESAASAVDSLSSSYSTLSEAVSSNTESITALEEAYAGLSSFDGDMQNSTIYNLVAGEVSESSTEAINGAQLYAEQQARISADEELTNSVASLSESVEDLVTIYQNLELTDGTFTGDMNGGSIINLADGDISEGSTDAVNGGQVYAIKTALEASIEETDETVEALSETVSGISEDVSTLSSSYATLAEAVSTNTEAIAANASDIASLTETVSTLSSTSSELSSSIAELTATDAELASLISDLETETESMSVDIASLMEMYEELSSSAFTGDMNGEKITNLAAGDVSEDSTDAINGSQLYEVVQSVETLSTSVASLSDTVSSISTSSDSSSSSSSDSASMTVSAVTGTFDTLVVNGSAAVGGDMSVGGTLTVGDTVSISASGIDAGGTVVTGVAAGEISATSTDAINGAQAYALASGIASLDKSLRASNYALNKKIEQSGASSAALASLKPLEFDPGAPTGFMVAVGNYGGETAAAVGMSHYFSKDLMGSISGTIGGGENMVSAALSMRLGRKDTGAQPVGAVPAVTVDALKALEAEQKTDMKAVKDFIIALAEDNLRMQEEIELLKAAK